MRSKLLALLGATVASGVLLFTTPAALAYSNTDSSSIPGSSDTIQANVWMSRDNGYGGFHWTSSAQLLGTDPYVAPWIEDQWCASVAGIGVSIGGVSGSSGGSSVSETWTNTNNWISDLQGSIQLSNNLTWLYIHSDTTAITEVNGNVVSATAGVDDFG